MKKTVFSILIPLILIAVFNVFFFVLTGPERQAAIWISYAFIHLAFLLFVLTPLMTKKSSARTLFGLSAGVVSFVYFILTVAAGIVFMILNFKSVTIPLLTHVALLAVYLIALFSVLLSHEQVGEQLQRQEFEMGMVKQNAARIQNLLPRIQDLKTQNEVRRAYDLIYTAPSKTNAATVQIDQNISGVISQMEALVNSGNNEELKRAAGAIRVLIQQRQTALQNTN
jgi:hypothetical protein